MPIQIEIINNHPAIRIAEKPGADLVRHLLEDEQLPASEINVVLVDDDYLKTLHRDFLNEDTFTDVITFNLSDPGVKEVCGEIYISADRARIHAAEFAAPLPEEIARLIIHGILHLKGYDDRTGHQRRQMRAREDHYLKKYASLLTVLRVTP